MICKRASIGKVLSVAAVFTWWLLSATAGASSPPNLLPGDRVQGAAVGSQMAPVVAAGGGGHLAVWADQRTGPTATSALSPNGRGSDIFALRLDASGNPVGEQFVIARSFTIEGKPRVAWNGQNWLVAWVTPWELWSYSSQILAVRVTASGTVLDDPPIVALTDADGFALIANGENPEGAEWLIVAKDTTRSVRIAADGSILQRKQLFVPSTILVVDVASAYNSTTGQREYLLATWSTASTSSPQGRRYTTDLNPIGDPFNLPSTVIASSGTGYFVAWAENTTYWDDFIYGQRLSVDGVLGPRLTLAGTGGQLPLMTPAQLDASWDGSNWWVAWLELERGVVYSRVSPTDAVHDFGGVAADPNAQGWTGGGFTVGGDPAGGAEIVWSESRAPTNTRDVRGVKVSAASVPAPAVMLSTSAPSQSRVDIAAGNNQFLAVFLSERSTENPRLMGQRLNSDGALIDLEPFEITSSPNLSGVARGPQVAWDGTRYMVVWSESGQVLAKRVATDGSVTDPTPLTITEGQMPNVAGHEGTFLVAFTIGSSPHFMYPAAVRVDGTSGSVLGLAQGLGYYFARYPDVAWAGNRWLVAWQRNPTHDDPTNNIYAAFVNVDGTLEPPGEFHVQYGGNPAIGVGGGRALFVSRTSNLGSIHNDIGGRLLNVNDGTFATPVFGISTEANPQINAAVAWNGTDFVVAWMDFRNAVAYFDYRTEVFAARVALDGTVRDLEGFAFGDRALEIDAAVASLNGLTLIGAATFREEPLAAGEPNAQSFRVATEVYGGGGNQWPVAVAAATSPTTGDVPLTVSFDATASSDPGGAIVSYDWDFGDGNSGSGGSASHAYNEPGQYVAELTVTDSSGAKTRNTVRVVVTPVNVAPTAVASANRTSGPAPLAVVFYGGDSYDPDQGIQNYGWTFSDGGTYWGATAYHTFQTQGTHTATLTVYDFRGATDSATVSITVAPLNQPPVAVASADPTSGVSPLSVSFSPADSYDPDGSITSYLWQFGDGQTSTDTNPVHVYELGGLYTATLTVADEWGGSGSDSVTIDVTQGDLTSVATGEVTELGTVSAGDYTSTHAYDGISEELTEQQTSGNPSKRKSQFSHTWAFNVISGPSYTFYVTAHHTENAENDHFNFEYSKDGASFVPMLVVTKTAPDGMAQSFSFPEDVGGTLYVRVTDTDRTNGNSAVDTLYVDEMVVVTSWLSGDTMPPAPPTGLTASPGDASVSLDWADNGESDLAGYHVYRATSSGGSYTALTAAPIATSAYVDGSVTNGTTYFYVVTALDTDGNESLDSNEASTTPGTGEIAVHVESIVVSLLNVGRTHKKGHAEVAAVDNLGGPVAGALVTGTFSVFNETHTATTDASGVAVFTTQSKANYTPSFSFCVDDVAAAGLSYDPAANVETCDTF